jgi:hypothetical protein
MSPEQPNNKAEVGYAYAHIVLLILGVLGYFTYKLFNINQMLIIGIIILIFTGYQYKHEVVIHSEFAITKTTRKQNNDFMFKFHIAMLVAIGLVYQPINYET